MSPDTQPPTWDAKVFPQLPSVLRTMQGDVPQADLEQASRYASNHNPHAGGRATIIKGNDNTVHWLILKSDRGEHPM